MNPALDPALLPALHDALVVAQTSSLGEAARRLNKTPSAVSQQLKRLETALGVALFERAGRGIRPSPAGEAALGPLTRVFDEASSLGGLLQELAGARIARLRIAASDYLGEALLVPAMRWAFREKLALRLEITTTNSVEARRLVTEGQVDTALVSSDREPLPEEIPLFRQPFAWIAPRVRRADTRHNATPLGARLAHEPLLRLRAGSQGRRLLDEVLGRRGIRPVSTIDVPSVSLMVSYVSQGLGIGLAPALALRHLDRARVDVEQADVPELEVRLVQRPTLKRVAAVRQFLDRLVADARRAGERLRLD